MPGAVPFGGGTGTGAYQLDSAGRLKLNSSGRRLITFPSDPCCCDGTGGPPPGPPYYCCQGDELPVTSGLNELGNPNKLRLTFNGVSAVGAGACCGQKTIVTTATAAQMNLTAVVTWGRDPGTGISAYRWQAGSPFTWNHHGTPPPYGPCLTAIDYGATAGTIIPMIWGILCTNTLGIRWAMPNIGRTSDPPENFVFAVFFEIPDSFCVFPSGVTWTPPCLKKVNVIANSITQFCFESDGIHATNRVGAGGTVTVRPV